jgi:uncharacterized damage-inducible protein DinB
MFERGMIQLPEPWLRVTHPELPVIVRAVVHALELAKEEVDRWCGDLTDAQVNARPQGIEPVAFQLRHLGRSLDRLLTYAEGKQLSNGQVELLQSETVGISSREEVFAEWNAAFHNGIRRLLRFSDTDMDEPRGVGKKQLQTTAGGILIHIADHAQRHVGQMITTVKMVRASR